MCGRFALVASRTQIEQEFDAAWKETLKTGWLARFNIAPDSEIPVIHVGKRDSERSCSLMQWRFIPPWMQPDTLKWNTINARSETVKQSQLFKEAYQYSRCLIPASGFFEWRRDVKPKEPWYFYPSNSSGLLAFAGLWSQWTDSEGDPHFSCTILTTQSDSCVAKVHHRMPVVISHENYQTWLNPTPLNSDQEKQMLHPSASGVMAAHRVWPAVNNARCDDARNLEPYEVLEWDF